MWCENGAGAMVRVQCGTRDLCLEEGGNTVRVRIRVGQSIGTQEGWGVVRHGHSVGTT